MERKIGERFEYKGKLYEVAEDNNCDYCASCAFLILNDCLPVSGNCSPLGRTDGKSVIFKEVK